MKGSRRSERFAGRGVTSFSIGELSEERIVGFLRAQRKAPFSYEEVGGAKSGGPCPSAKEPPQVLTSQSDSYVGRMAHYGGQVAHFGRKMAWAILRGSC